MLKSDQIYDQKFGSKPSTTNLLALSVLKRSIMTVKGLNDN